MGEGVQGVEYELGLGSLVAPMGVAAVAGVDWHAAFLARVFRSIGDDGARARAHFPVLPRWHVISQWYEAVGEEGVVALVGVEPHESVRGSIAGSVHPPGWR